MTCRRASRQFNFSIKGPVQNTGQYGTSEDMEVLYEKLAVAYPLLLVKVDVPVIPEARSLTAAYPSSCGCGSPIISDKERCAELLNLSTAPAEVKVPQGRCLKCGRRYVGTWSYQAEAVTGKWKDVRSTKGAFDGEFFYLANLRRVVVFTSQLMRLILGCVDRCQSSFAGVTELLVDITGQQEYQWKRPLLTTAYAVYALSLFLGDELFCAIQWPSDMLCRQGLDAMFLRMRKQFADCLATRWGVDHQCKLCAGGYLLGVDGKHGARRFTCAWKDVGIERIQSLGGVAIRKPCAQRAVVGSIFCAEHAAAGGRLADQASQEASNEDEEEAKNAVDVLRTRRGSPNCAPLTQDATEPEYEVRILREDGVTSTSWVPASQLSPKLIMAFEESRATKRADIAVEKVRKHKHTEQSAAKKERRATQDTIFDLDEADSCQQCGIEKQKQHKKRLSIGGIIALVTSCQLFVGWRAYLEGEGLSDVYVALAEVLQVLLSHGRAPEGIFYDNACALRAFVRNSKRATLSEVAKHMADAKYLLDIWHRWNHLRAANACLKDPELAKELDPYHENNRELAKTYNTEACEQAFSWLDHFCPYLLEMGPGFFVAHLTMMMDRRNDALVRRRNKGDISRDAIWSEEELRRASRTRFEHLRQRETDAMRFLFARPRHDVSM